MILIFEFLSDEKNQTVFVIVLKKVKHRLVENMSSGTADALGLSRAILCNGEVILMTDYYKFMWNNRTEGIRINMFHLTDGLVKRLEELEKTAELYKGAGQ